MKLTYARGRALRAPSAQLFVSASLGTETVGHAEMAVLHLQERPLATWLRTLDSVADGDFAGLAAGLLESGREGLSCVLLISRMEIEEEFRGQGYGSALLREVIERSRPYVNVVALEADPLGVDPDDDAEAYEAAKRRLLGFYTRLGFTAENDILVLDLDSGR